MSMNTSRLQSLDALRGFDMFWIMGAEEIFHALFRATGSSFFGVISEELTHPTWNGFHFYDLIFPLFLFMSGVATPYSVGRALDKGEHKNKLLKRVIQRGLILVLLGVIYNNGLVIKPLSEIRLPSVLGRIGLAYMFANIIYLYFKHKAQVIWFFAILIGYWALLAFGSAPGFQPGNLTMEGNMASYIDRLIIPGKLYLDIHDPEGLVSTLPAISTGLLGIMTGDFLKNSNQEPIKKFYWMIGLGILLIILAHVWNLVLPINKNLWTSSFVFITGGYSLVLLGLFYYIIDIREYKKWSFFFRIIGMNSILIYISSVFIDWEYSTKAFFGWIGQLTAEPMQFVIFSIALVFLKWLFLLFMYLKNVFLRV